MSLFLHHTDDSTHPAGIGGYTPVTVAARPKPVDDRFVWGGQVHLVQGLAGLGLEACEPLILTSRNCTTFHVDGFGL
jgi:hypothetical protein